MVNQQFIVACLYLFFLTPVLAISSIHNPLSPNPLIQWRDQALALQQTIDTNAPLHEVTFLGTHNSYNSKAYQLPFKRYLDPNQDLTITEQLQLGVRSLELDVHLAYDTRFRKQLLLCHANHMQMGCSPYDRTLEEGLLEIREWLIKNPDQLLLIYLEIFIGPKTEDLANLLNQHLGKFILKPATLRPPTPSSSCFALPTTHTKKSLLAQGNQVILVSKQCLNSKNGTPINDVVFSGIGEYKGLPYSFLETRFDHFQQHLPCGQIFNRADPLHASLWRVYEDQTFFSSMNKSHKRISDVNLQQLLKCDINWPALDRLSWDDPRLFTFIWSWAPFYPSLGDNNCAAYYFGVGMQNHSCQERFEGYACRALQSNEFQVIRYTGIWIEGENACQQQLGAEWHFTSPNNAFQLEKIKASMNLHALSKIWINYHRSKGQWQANEEKGHG